MTNDSMKTPALQIINSNILVEEITRKDKEKIFFVLDPDRPGWAFINEDGLEILKVHNGVNSAETISKIISDKYETPGYEKTLQVVGSFLEEMKKCKVLYERDMEEPHKNKFHGLALELTKRCNLRCAHCYLSAGEKGNNELTLDEIKTVLKSIKDSGGISIAIGGGEPLLRDDLIEIIEYASSLDLLISLGTNGTLIDEKMASSLCKLPVKVQISLDGATKETHESIRGKGSFDLTVKGIDYLIDAGMGKDIVIAFTPMKLNVNEVPDIIDFALDKQIPVIQFPPLTYSGRAKERWEELKLSDNEMLLFWELVAKRSAELRGKLDLLADCFSMNLNNVGVPHRCSIGTQFRIDPEGYVYPCQCFHYGSEYCLGNIKKESLENIVSGQKIIEIKKVCFQRPLKIDKCKRCKWINFCGSGCMGNAFENNGTILTPESCSVRKKWIEKLFEIKLNEILART